MNTKKVLGTILGLAFVALLTVSTNVIVPDMDGQDDIERSKVCLDCRAKKHNAEKADS